MNEIWTLLWSKKQKCFHIERASDLCCKNANAMYLIKDINDYHPVMIGTRAACDYAAAEWRWMLEVNDHA